MFAANDDGQAGFVDVVVQQSQHPFLFFHHPEQGTEGRQRDGIRSRGIEERCRALDVKGILAGQLLAWRQLNAAGYFLAANPGNAFFYLFTGLHGLHLLGGLVALGMTANKVWRGGFEVKEVRLSVQLCAVYWHFLLALWLVLFTLLTPWVGEFAAICRQLLT